VISRVFLMKNFNMCERVTELNKAGHLKALFNYCEIPDDVTRGAPKYLG
jgi:hypothetical protein